MPETVKKTDETLQKMKHPSNKRNTICLVFGSSAATIDGNAFPSAYAKEILAQWEADKGETLWLVMPDGKEVKLMRAPCVQSKGD